MCSSTNEDGCREFEVRIKEIYAEYLARFIPAGDRVEAAIYVRTSAGGISSLENQLHSTLSHAVKEGISVQPEHIYHDRGSVSEEVRHGLHALQRLLDQGTVKIVIVVSLNRLYRKCSQLQEFLDANESELAVRFIQVNLGNDSTASAKQQFAVDEQQAVFIRKILDMSLSGMSIDEIVVSLNNDAE
jgi:hypothetical protein